MDWKEFLKPTLGKILIFVLLWGSVAFNIYVGENCLATDIVHPRYCVITFIIFPIGAISGWVQLPLILLIGIFYGSFQYPLYEDVLVFFSLFYSYFISCLSAYIYNKFKPKK